MWLDDRDGKISGMIRLKTLLCGSASSVILRTQIRNMVLEERGDWRAFQSGSRIGCVEGRRCMLPVRFLLMLKLHSWRAVTVSASNLALTANWKAFVARASLEPEWYM